MLALLFGIIILCFAAIMDFFYRKEIKSIRQINAEEISALVDERMKLREQYHTMEVRLEEEIEALDLAIGHMEAEKDPDSMFPAMESSISECNAKANVRLLRKLYEDLFSPQ